MKKAIFLLILLNFFLFIGCGKQIEYPLFEIIKLSDKPFGEEVGEYNKQHDLVTLDSDAVYANFRVRTDMPIDITMRFILGIDVYFEETIRITKTDDWEDIAFGVPNRGIGFYLIEVWYNGEKKLYKNLFWV